MALHINIEDLLSTGTVESERIEYKEGWNPDPIYRSICAFANDFENTGGGYILIGVAENPVTRVADRPVLGVSTEVIANIQQDMIGFNNLMRPYYAPKFSVESVDDKLIVVLWVVAGSERPYEVPESINARNKTWKYYIRRYASSIEARGADREELIALSNNIPFDDRANTQALVSDISMVLVKNHLVKIGSRLATEVGKRSDTDVLGQMGLISGAPEHLLPKNVGLMMFAEDPSVFFPNTEVEIVSFPNGEAEAYTEYPKIKGTIPQQIKQTLDWFKVNLLEEQVVKPKDKAESIRIWNYPLQAIEETLVNAFFHRDYQVREPVEIRIYQQSIVFINHGGPDRSIQLQSFQTGIVRARRYRNRRLGEFLKELELTEGRATGIPTILKSLKENGSPEPRFNTDDNRTFFEVELLVNPEFHQVSGTGKIADKDELVSEIFRDINDRLDDIISKAPNAIRNKTRDVAGDIAGDVAAREFQKRIAKGDKTIAGDIVGAIDRDTVVDVAIDAQEFVKEKMEKILMFCRESKQRKEIFEVIEIVNNVKNYNAYMAPLVAMGWIAMTIPGKPTSPNQKYITTLKGRIITELLNYVDHGE